MGYYLNVHLQGQRVNLSLTLHKYYQLTTSLIVALNVFFECPVELLGSNEESNVFLENVAVYRATYRNVPKTNGKVIRQSITQQYMSIDGMY